MADETINSTLPSQQAVLIGQPGEASSRRPREEGSVGAVVPMGWAVPVRMVMPGIRHRRDTEMVEPSDLHRCLGAGIPGNGATAGPLE
jgi:hypothetical protein